MAQNSVFVLTVPLLAHADSYYWRVHVFSELMKGRARFGFSDCDAANLVPLQDRVRQVKWSTLTAMERECWSHGAFLLDVKPGDYFLYPALPETGQCTLVSIEGTYGFTEVWDPEFKGDYRHSVPCVPIAAFDTNDAAIATTIAGRFKGQGTWHRMPLEGEFADLVFELVARNRRSTADVPAPMPTPSNDDTSYPARTPQAEAEPDRQALTRARHKGYVTALQDVLRATRGDEDAERTINAVLSGLKEPSLAGHVLNEKLATKRSFMMQALDSLKSGSPDLPETEPETSRPDAFSHEAAPSVPSPPQVASIEAIESPKPAASEESDESPGRTRATVLLNAMGDLIDRGSDEDADEIALLNMFDETESTVNRETRIEVEASEGAVNALERMEKAIRDVDEDDSDEMAVLDLVWGTTPTDGLDEEDMEQAAPVTDPIAERPGEAVQDAAPVQEFLEGSLRSSGQSTAGSGTAVLRAESVRPGSAELGAEPLIVEPLDPDRVRSSSRNYLVVQVPVFDVEKPGVVGFLKDITPRGLQVADLPAEPGQQISLFVKADHVTDVSAFVLHAECRWARLDGNNQLTSGFKVVAIDEVSMEQIKKLIGFLSLRP